MFKYFELTKEEFIKAINNGQVDECSPILVVGSKILCRMYKIEEVENE